MKIFIKGFKENFDIWSGWHFFGPYFLCDFIGPWLAAAVAFGWEIIDLFFSKTRKWLPVTWRPVIDKVFDRRGVSWGDLILGCIAILIWIVKHSA